MPSPPRKTWFPSGSHPRWQARAYSKFPLAAGLAAALATVRGIQRIFTFAGHSELPPFTLVLAYSP